MVIAGEQQEEFSRNTIDGDRQKHFHELYQASETQGKPNQNDGEHQGTSPAHSLAAIRQSFDHSLLVFLRLRSEELKRINELLVDALR
jgi:hypothetical protein